MNFKNLLPHLVALAVFFVTVFFNFAPQFSGKSLRMGDIDNYKGATKEMRDYQAATGERTNWTGSMFGGMPTYQLSTISEGNQLRVAQPVVQGFLPRPAGYFFAGMLCAYLLLICLGVNPWLSIAGALGAALATNGFILFETGHTSKILTVFYLPLVAAGTVLAFRKKYILGGLLFAFGMGLAILANHLQMLYYFGLTFPILGIVYLVEAIREKTLPHFGKAIGALVVGLLIALGAGSNNVIPTKEYLSSTSRGGQVLETPVGVADAEDAPETGLEWEYAMQWSNGMKDLLASYAPLAAGGGSGQSVENNSDLGKSIRRAGFQLPAEFPAPTYHGALPFTEGPSYLGAVVWALFLFGLFSARMSIRWWLGLGTLFVFALSMGKNLEGFNRFLYNTLPLLEQFRAPSSALSISSFMMIALGMVGVHDWLQTREEDEGKAKTQLLRAGITAAVLGLAVIFVFPGFINFSLPTDAAQLQRYFGSQVDVNTFLGPLEDTRAALYSADAWRSFLYVGLSFGVLFLLYRKTITPLIAGLALAALLAVDFGGINGRYLKKEDWRRTPRNAQTFTPSTADQQILADNDPNFRVFNLTVSPFRDASTSYFHKSIGGYSPVKLRRVDDLISGYLMQRDPDVLDMLNTKYFILPGQDGQPAAQRNPNAYGNAWLVSNIQLVNSNDAEFAALGSVDPLRQTAIVHEEFSDAVSGLQPTGQGSITLTEYQPNALTYSFQSNAEQLAVFSEIWYGPDLGWEVTIDDQPAELIRANYVLRALRVPAGQHTIKMTFTSSSYQAGVSISWVSSLLILLGLVGYLGYQLWQSRKEGSTEQ
ncbi:YfhO family protein [Lewinella sp. W8]|uniref:YfhO family protein n=1 Tax=Lewinella sp. W8 TaxID=2528208 RepID=UPI00106766F2|nr:YfhO family protein [Lewinella sp. W8]MTB50971.1 YfhO family protein [Lewinella sp. W8]